MILRGVLALLVVPWLCAWMPHGIPPAPPAPNTYYFSTSGDDSNDCQSPATACQTIGKANGITYPAAPTILFKGGDSFTGCLTFNSTNLPSNSPSNVTTIGQYGTGPFTLTANCTGIRQAAITINGVSGVTVQDGNLIGNGGHAGAQFGIHLTNPSGSSKSKFIFQRMTFTNFYYDNTPLTDWGSGIYLRASSPIDDVQVLNNTCAGATITSLDDNCVLSSAVGHAITNVVYRGNLMYNLGSSPAGLGGTKGNGIISGQVSGGLQEFNLGHDLGANTTTCGGPAVGWTYDADHITIQFSEAYLIQPYPSYVSGCDWNGFDLDGFVSDSVIQYTYAHDTFGAMGLMWADTNSTVFTNNVLRYNIGERNAGNTTQASYYGCILLDLHSSVTTGMAIYNNSCWSDGPVASNVLSIQQGEDSTGLVANNVFYASTNNVYWIRAPNLPASMQILNNDYYRLFTNPLISWGPVSFNGTSAITNWQDAYAAASATPSSIGTDLYKINDTLTLTGGTFTSAAVFRVTTLGGSNKSVVSASIPSGGGGSGYVNGDKITLAGGTFSVAAVLTVATSSGGTIQTVSVDTAGAYSVLPSNPVAQGSTTGGGSGATFTVVWQGAVGTVAANLNGVYSVTPSNPVSTTPSGSGSGATLTVTFQSPSGQEKISGISVAKTSDPQFVDAGNGGTCSWTPSSTLSWPPSGCPTAYGLQVGSPMIGTGLDLTMSPYSLNVGSRDYYGNAIPSGSGTGYNIGADGAP